MIDSNGKTVQKYVNCANCKREIVFWIYTPELGHDGGELNISGCITGDSHELIEDAVLYKVGILKGEISCKTFFFEESGETYHRGGYKIPIFGFYPGEILCLCRICKGLTPSAVVERQISHATDNFFMEVITSKDIEFAFKKRSKTNKKILFHAKKISTLFSKLRVYEAKEKKRTALKIMRAIENIYPTK